MKACDTATRGPYAVGTNGTSYLICQGKGYINPLWYRYTLNTLPRVLWNTNTYDIHSQKIFELIGPPFLHTVIYLQTLSYWLDVVAEREEDKDKCRHHRYIYNIFYATETYIMHFLEAAQFLNAPVLSGRKVNFTLGPTVGVWALKLLFSHLHKITN